MVICRLLPTWPSSNISEFFLFNAVSSLYFTFYLLNFSCNDQIKYEYFLNENSVTPKEPKIPDIVTGDDNNNNTLWISLYGALLFTIIAAVGSFFAKDRLGACFNKNQSVGENPIGMENSVRPLVRL